MTSITKTSFVLSDAAFSVAQSDAAKVARTMADADVKASQTFDALLSVLLPLSGSQSAEAVTQWGTISRAFKDAYAARLVAKTGKSLEDCTPSADKAWSRAVTAAGLAKPQTQAMAQAAAAKAAQRKAESSAKASAKAAPAGTSAVPLPSQPTPALDLEGNISHIANLIRKGDFAAAQSMLITLANVAKSSTIIRAVPPAPEAPTMAKTAKVTKAVKPAKTETVTA